MAFNVPLRHAGRLAGPLLFGFLATTTWSLAATARDLSEVSEIDKDTARRLLDEGDARFADRDFEGALEKYRAADAIMGVPTTASEVGKALEQLGRLVEARDAYLRIVRYPRRDDEPEVFTAAREAADRRAAALAARVATLRVDIDFDTEAGDDPKDGTSRVRLSIDGEAINAAAVGHAISVDPGTRRVRVEATGYLGTERHVVLSEGGKEVLRLRLERDPDAPAEVPPGPDPSRPDPGETTPGTPTQEPSSFPVFATIGFAVGGAGLLLGGITGGLAIAQEGDLATACTDDQRCPPDRADDIDRANLLANLSNVGFAVGAAGAIFGVVSLFTLDASSRDDDDGDDQQAAARWSVTASPTSVWLRGTY
ncbi:MAG: hypothetical protein AAF928_20905 [Myxococcota bacterium]